MYTGNCISACGDQGFTNTREVLMEFIRDTRYFHLWVISSNSPLLFLRRILLYTSFESCVYLFSQLEPGGARHVGGKFACEHILRESWQYSQVRKFENYAIALAGYLGTTSKRKLPKVLSILRKLRGGSIYSPEFFFLEPSLYDIKFTENCSIIYKNIILEHTSRRILEGNSKKMATKTLINKMYSIPIEQSKLNLPQILNTLGWSLFLTLGTGIALLILLRIFQLSNQDPLNRIVEINSTVIDI